MNKNIVKINNKGASLLEVLIAMVILTVAFLGIMALSISLLNNNALSTKINTATSIAQAQVSQLNCLGTTNAPSSFTSSPITIACPAGDTCYKYEITPAVLNPVTNTDTRTNVTACINPVLAVGGDAPGEFPPSLAYPKIGGGIGITVPYTVTITLAPNPTNLSAINAQVDVGWHGVRQHIITMFDIIS